MWEKVIVDYAPLIIVMGSVIALVCMSKLYIILKMIFAPASVRFRPRAGAHQALQRAAVLDQRLRNLEEILAANKLD